MVCGMSKTSNNIGLLMVIIIIIITTTKIIQLIAEITMIASTMKEDMMGIDNNLMNLKW